MEIVAIQTNYKRIYDHQIKGLASLGHPSKYFSIEVSWQI